MASAPVVLEAQGLTQTQLLWGALVRKLGTLKPLMETVGSYLESSIESRFVRQVGPDGKRWKPSVRAQATGGMTLTDSRRLRDSITHNADDRSVAVGTNVVYAAAHQFGLNRPVTIGEHNRLIHEAFGRPLRFGVWQTVREHSVNPNIPARPFVGLDAEDVDEIQHLTIDYMGGVMAQAVAA
ncbi:phage virion morphogenesis protein [Caulobacter soli]|uniref:phage virion morphogenesis protein n=1 Tax=Caulobacter soli TaxID=2708539 RepID=UPI0013EDCD31|nr:phage virion morphogenesis protein [Caulobacter soli]